MEYRKLDLAFEKCFLPYVAIPHRSASEVIQKTANPEVKNCIFKLIVTDDHIMRRKMQVSNMLVLQDIMLAAQSGTALATEQGS
jgi:hypothetical protein